MSKNHHDSSHTAATRLFVLDTNVLMHDPTALFRFDEHDLFLPMVVLEELDKAKKGLSEVSQNVRQVSRNIDELLKGVSDITLGCPLPNLAEESGVSTGRLFFQTEIEPINLPSGLQSNLNDNSILAATIALIKQQPERSITLVSKDINLRIKATALGLIAEDYFSDAQEINDLDLLYSGMNAVSGELFVNIHNGDDLTPALEGQLAAPFTNSFIHPETPSGDIKSYAYRIVNDGVKSQLQAIDTSSAVWGINPRNPAQHCAMNLLLDPNVDIVTLCGSAGTGKTLLALAAGLVQALEPSEQTGSYSEIIMTRVTVPIGEDIGFLPGTEEEKMTPWMGALMDNLEVLASTQNDGMGSWARNTSNDFLMNKIKIRSLNFMRGRTFLNRYIIVDEAQNLTPKQMKALITRAGPGSKIVCLGNLAQIDTPYLSETTSGLTYVVERFKQWPHSGHITLTRGERSRLADFASQQL